MKLLSRFWPALIPILSIVLAAVFGCATTHSGVTATVGEACPKLTIAGDETYIENDKVCVEMHKTHTRPDIGDDINGWTYVYVVGMQNEALFKSQTDAEIWARSQPYVRTRSQVR